MSKVYAGAIISSCSFQRGVLTIDPLDAHSAVVALVKKGVNLLWFLNDIEIRFSTLSEVVISCYCSRKS